MSSLRLDKEERRALKYALKDFKGEIYLFGSRSDRRKKGGDIDLLLIPEREVNRVKLSLMIERRFFSVCEERIDVIIYDGGLFCKEILKNAKRLDLERI